MVAVVATAVVVVAVAVDAVAAAAAAVAVVVVVFVVEPNSYGSIMAPYFYLTQVIFRREYCNTSIRSRASR